MSKSSKHENIAAYLFIAPFMLGIFVFYVYAFIKNFYYSFTNKTSFGKESIIGFANYFSQKNFTVRWHIQRSMFLSVFLQ